LNGQCQVCATGTKPNPAQKQCVSVCTVGEKFVDGVCAKVPAGQFFDRGDKGNWTKCPANTFQDLVGQQSCKSCPAGRVPNDTATDCILKCAANEIILDDKCTPKLAAKPGQFEDASAGGAIKGCAPGTYQDLVGQMSCKKCPQGSYQELTAQSECFACPAGTFQTLVGQTSCQQCAIGTYMDEPGASECYPCQGVTGSMPAQDLYCDTVGAIDPKICPIGTKNNSNFTGCVDACAVAEIFKDGQCVNAKVTTGPVFPFSKKVIFSPTLTAEGWGTAASAAVFPFSKEVTFSPTLTAEGWGTAASAAVFPFAKEVTFSPTLTAEGWGSIK
jgi:hypothetical protein